MNNNPPSLSQRSRLRGLCNRWHKARGKKVPTCTFCQEPNVKDIKETAQVKSPATIQTQTLEEELKLLKEKAAFRDSAWSCAQAGLSIVEAVRVCKTQLQTFCPMVEQEFGETYNDLVETARLENLRSITLAALNAAKEGDTRLLLRLEEKGVFNCWLRQEKEQAQSIRKLSNDELEEKLQVILHARGINPAKLPPTIHFVDSLDGSVMEEQKSEPALEQTEITTDFARPSERIVEEETTQQPLSLVEESTTHAPVVFTPQPGGPLHIQERRPVPPRSRKGNSL